MEIKIMNWLIEHIKYKIQHYNPVKYWKYRNSIVEKKGSKFIRLYKLMKIKKMDAFNNASLGTNLDISAEFVTPPIQPEPPPPPAQYGKNTTIYHQVTIGSSDTKTAPAIGDNVIIYPGAKIVGNIKIGNNVIIGIGSVVVKDIPNNAIVAGVPAKIIRMRDEKC